VTEASVMRAHDLIHTRDEILEFLTANDPASPLVKGYLDSKYEHQREDGEQLPTAEVSRISIEDARSVITAQDEEPQSLAYWYISRTVLERALRREIEAIAAELKDLGVT
jgi:hypothetical protein